MIEAQRGTELLGGRTMGGEAAADARQETSSRNHLRVVPPPSLSLSGMTPRHRLFMRRGLEVGGLEDEKAVAALIG